MRRALAALVCGVMSAGAFAAQPVGRFFFTPAERAQLDGARLNKQRPAAVPSSETPAEPLPLPQTVTYGGIVRRSDGKSMLWINNRLADEKEALTGLNLRGRVRSDGAVTLQVPNTGSSIDVKVGQSVEVLTGRVAEGRRAEEPREANDPQNPKASVEDGKSGSPADKAVPASKAAPVAAAAAARAEPAARGNETAQEQALRHREDPKEQRTAAGRR
ncbi:MAG: hypothetical protein ACXW2A_01175 [Burkholderiales bacterium]